MSLDIGLTGDQRSAVLALLNPLLADQHVLYVKTRNYHWNVTGPHFNDLHKFLEAHYEQLGEAIDEVAERVRALGGVALGAMADFLKHARLKETLGAPPHWKTMLANLLADHEATIRQLRGDVDACGSKFGDSGTQDFLTGLMEDHEKMAWMLRSYLAD